MNWTSAQQDHGDGEAYILHRNAYFDEQERIIREQQERVSKGEELKPLPYKRWVF